MYKKFLFLFIGLSATLLLSAGAFNYLIDPYSVWQVRRYPGFNMWALKADSVERMGKAVSIISAEPQPEVVFIGSSQVDWGIDAAAATELLGRPVYNFGVLGMTAYEQRRYVEHVLAVDPAVKEIVLAVDFTKLVSGSRYKTPFDESFSGIEDQIGKKYVIPVNAEKTLFSLQALKDSYASMKANREHGWQVPYYKEGKTLTNEALMGFFTRERWRFNRSLFLMQREGWLEQPELNEKCFQEIVRIAELCREHGVGLKLYVPPVHAEAAIAYEDCLDSYVACLKKLASIAPLWTFFDIDAISASPVKAGKLSEDTNAYFWDSVHHKEKVGQWIIARLYGKELADKPNDFGLELDETNLDNYLSDLRSKLKAWKSAHLEVAEDTRYYAGFSEEIPSQVLGKGQPRPVVAMIQAGTEEERPVFRLHGSDYLEIRGNGFLPPELLHKSYLRLADAQGKSLYTLAEPTSAPETASFMRNRAYEDLGFLVKEPLKDVPAGEYDIFWVALSKDGQVYESASLGKVMVLE